MNSSKIGTSIMFCGNATGAMMPPYVCYKSLHLYPQWMEKGPKNTRYNRTTSGWFTEIIFKDWFFKTGLPKIRKTANRLPSVVIGDNLAAHFSEEVIDVCRSNNIKFLLLRPNTTDKTEPLDVAFFIKTNITQRKFHVMNGCEIRRVVF